MDTLHNNTTGNKSQAGFRSILILAGIVIAIICSLVSMKALNFGERAEASAGSIEIPASVNVNLVVKAASTIGHSVVVFTKE